MNIDVIRNSTNDFLASAHTAATRSWTTVLTKALMPAALKIQDFVQWNFQELHRGSSLAMGIAPFVLVMSLVNARVMPTINKMMITHGHTTPTQKLKALYHALPTSQNVADLFTALPETLRNELDEAIYHECLSKGTHPSELSLDDPYFGQHFREGFGTDAKVRQAILNLINQIATR